MASPPTAIDQRGHLRVPTLRRDAWWLQPLVTLVVLLGFVAYGIWVAFVDRNYVADPYISPFYSPCLAAKCGDHATAAIFGTWWPLSPALLVLYTLSCHSCRHLCGGQVDRFSRSPLRFWLWRRISALNASHMLYAWVSLVFVALTDLYVRLVATGAIHDPRLL